MAFPLPGSRSLARSTKPGKTQGTLTPVTEQGKRFDEPFLVDTTNRLIKEQYEHYRPHWS